LSHAAIVARELGIPLIDDPYQQLDMAISQVSQSWFSKKAQSYREILGITDKAFAGRDWDLWAAYNTRTQAMTVTYGIKEKGSLQDEDNFNDGDYAGWSLLPFSNVAWSVTSSALQAQYQAVAPSTSRCRRPAATPRLRPTPSASQTAMNLPVSLAGRAKSSHIQTRNLAAQRLCGRDLPSVVVVANPSGSAQAAGAGKQRSTSPLIPLRT
jgi:hypothetical protein